MYRIMKPWNPCPYVCNNKTEYGYCKTTGCINPKYSSITLHSNNVVAWMPAPEPYRGEQDDTDCRTCRNNPNADLNPPPIPLFSDGLVLELLMLAFANKDEFLRRMDAIFKQYPMLKREYEKFVKQVEGETNKVKE